MNVGYDDLIHCCSNDFLNHPFRFSSQDFRLPGLRFPSIKCKNSYRSPYNAFKVFQYLNGVGGLATNELVPR